MGRTLALFASMVFWLGTAALCDAQSEVEALVGPQRRGLCLQLRTKHKGGAGSENLISIKLLNRGTEEITLKTKFDYEDGDTFQKFFKESISFTTFPELLPMPFSTAGMARSSPQVEFVLKPGKTVSVNLSVNKNYLNGGSLSHQNLWFTKPGKYFIRAHITLYDLEGKAIKLWSNEQPFICQNSQEHPDAAVATIIGYEKQGEKEVAKLNLGSDSGAKVGDDFHYWTKRGGFKFTVVELGSYHCKASVEPLGRATVAGLKMPDPKTKIYFAKRKSTR